MQLSAGETLKQGLLAGNGTVCETEQSSNWLFPVLRGICLAACLSRRFYAGFAVPTLELLTLILP